MYLYIYKNRTTGKRYIGYTTGDIHTYLGSGRYWKNHCKKHGGLTESNIERVWYEKFDSKEDALEFLKTFELENPEYWKDDNWANLVRETLETSAFRGNMEDIFERHGNPFSGGDIQRKAHAEGKHDYDKSEAGRKSWKNRDPTEATEKMMAGHVAWREDNKEEFLSTCRKGAQAAKLVLAKRIEYNGICYIGWGDFKKATGITKYMFLKYNMGTVN